MRTEPEIKDAPDAVELRDVKGEVEYKDVGFRYAEDKPWVLRDVSLKIIPARSSPWWAPPAEARPRSAQLLERFYDVTEGSVSIDGLDVRAVTQESLRRSIGIIQQDVFIFAGTVRDNIATAGPTQATRR